MKTIFLVLTSLLLAVGCGKKEVIHIYSLDKTQSITIINQDDSRFIIDGEHKKIPKSNFIKLNTSEIDPMGDALHICWDSEGYEWEIVVHDSEVIESKLDTNRFNFRTSLPVDERSIPNQKKFEKNNCAVFDFYSMRLIPDKGAIVEYEE